MLAPAGAHTGWLEMAWRNNTPRAAIRSRLGVRFMGLSPIAPMQSQRNWSEITRTMLGRLTPPVWPLAAEATAAAAALARNHSRRVGFSGATHASGVQSIIIARREVGQASGFCRRSGWAFDPRKFMRNRAGAAGQSWRTHSCVPRRHSCRGPRPTVEASSETRRCRHECLRHEDPHPLHYTGLVTTIEELEDELSRPSGRDVEFLRHLEGDILILGASGKM